MSIDIRKPHYRLALKNGEASIVCVQDFDYSDYTFATGDAYDWYQEAFNAARAYNLKTANVEKPKWEVVYENKPHYCTKPQLSACHPDLVVGCIIKCTECGQHWKYIGTDSGMQWDPYPAVIRWEKTDPPMTIRF